MKFLFHQFYYDTNNKVWFYGNPSLVFSWIYLGFKFFFIFRGVHMRFPKGAHMRSWERICTIDRTAVQFPGYALHL